MFPFFGWAFVILDAGDDLQRAPCRQLPGCHCSRAYVVEELRRIDYFESCHLGKLGGACLFGFWREIFWVLGPEKLGDAGVVPR